jgi:hypothetical protein
VVKVIKKIDLKMMFQLKKKWNQLCKYYCSKDELTVLKKEETTLKIESIVLFVI